jgi:hypothetical protein
MLSLSDGGSKQPLLCHFASLALGEKSSDLVALAHTQMAHHISSGSQHPGFISAGSQSARQVSAKCAHNLHTSASLLLFVRAPWNTLHYGPTYAILRSQGRPGWKKKLHYAGQNCNFMQIIMFSFLVQKVWALHHFSGFVYLNVVVETCQNMKNDRRGQLSDSQ